MRSSVAMERKKEGRLSEEEERETVIRLVRDIIQWLPHNSTSTIVLMPCPLN